MLLDNEAGATLKRVSDAVAAAGGEAFLVGGAVRDGLAGRDVKDYDIEVHRLSEDALRTVCSRFGVVNAVGASFGVLKLNVDGLELDLSLPRRDSKSSGRAGRGIIATSDPNMGIVEALKRRDFTINAIAYNLNSDMLVDPYGGVDDLKGKVLRVVDPGSFAEDPLRSLRAAGFTARFGLSVPGRDRAVISAAANELDVVSRERQWEELVKLLVKSVKPSVGLQLGYETGVMQRVLPALSALHGIPQDSFHHPEGDAWVHSLLAADAAVGVSVREQHSTDVKLVSVLAALLHDVGKAPVWLERGDAIGHDKAGVPLIRESLRVLRSPKAVAGQVAAVTAVHMRGHTLGADVKVSAVRKLVRDVGPQNVPLLLDVLDADSFGRDVPGSSELLERAYLERCESSVKLSRLLSKLEEVSVEGTVTNLVSGRQLLDAGISSGEHVGFLIEEANKMDCSSAEALSRVLRVAEREPNWWVNGRGEGRVPG